MNYLINIYYSQKPELHCIEECINILRPNAVFSIVNSELNTMYLSTPEYFESIFNCRGQSETEVSIFVIDSIDLFLIGENDYSLVDLINEYINYDNTIIINVSDIPESLVQKVSESLNKTRVYLFDARKAVSWHT